MKFKIIYILYFSLGMTGISAQTNTQDTWTFNEYIQHVREKNLSTKAQQYNISMAEAAILAAEILPDPQIDLESSNNGVSADLGYTLGAGISWTLELGKKRKARISYAKNEAEFSKLQFQDYLRNLMAEAAIRYIDAIKSKILLDVHKDSYENMRKLAQSDSIRHALGDISKVSAQQSKVEALSLLNELHQQESTQRQNITSLAEFTGDYSSEKIAEGNLNFLNRSFDLNELISAALLSRTDALASQQNISLAESLVGLEKANRHIDLGLNIGAEHNTVANNVVAPSPVSNAVKLGVSIPLKFSNRKNADLKIAYMKHSQAELEYRQTENIIRIEIRNAYQQYQSTQKQIQQFDNGILKEAKDILEGIKYSYHRGESSILEVLNAQRTYNELRKNYCEVLAENATALVDLERKSGIWDIDF
ncbi:TolC family protein [Chryseobacterium sp. MYb264]|uniref:TolC family protein n=1 Tax=Chryseobacterium sp. MYb264 TaxID=2745153 RepID=UPI002E14C7D2|nr:TolC family protein [Chryseobacterium sp. MYb264]